MYENIDISVIHSWQKLEMIPNFYQQRVDT